jgi:DNA-binding NarL/FixJ family response regulator
MPKRILIVDDNLKVRRAIRTSLENHFGFEVCGEAVDGLSAIEKTRELNPDLVLLDLVMPDINGVDVASALKEMMPELPIIMLTGYDDKVGKELASVAGANIVLAKHDGMEKVIDSVKYLLGR